MDMEEEIYRWNILGKSYWKNRTPEQKWLHNYLLYPFLFDFIKKGNYKSVLDFGCADGELICYCANNGVPSDTKLYTFDKAKEMIKLCNDNVGKNACVLNNLRNHRFDLIIANMVIQDVFKLDELLLHIKKHLNKNGVLVVTFPHPDHFDEVSKKPTAKHEIVDADDENIVKEKMYWSDCQNHWTYKYHRPLDVYKNIFDVSGFRIIETVCPKPIEEGRCDISLYEYNSLNQTVIAMVLEEK